MNIGFHPFLEFSTFSRSAVINFQTDNGTSVDDAVFCLGDAIGRLRAVTVEAGELTE